MTLSRALPRSVIATALATALIVPLPALAQSQLDRMQVLSEQANALMNEALIAQIPALDGNLPAPEWDDRTRTAYACMMDGYVDAVGSDAVDQMLDQMEAALDGATTESLMSGEMEQGIDMPEGMTEAQTQALLASCGVMEVMMARMAESGAMTVMMQQQR
jgi:hypothetical protein